MKIGIISDTHDNIENVHKAIRIFRRENVDYVLHAGDIVSPQTAQAFTEVNSAKFIAVLGNCDHDRFLLKQCIKGLGGELCEQIYTGQIGDRQVFMTHKPDSAQNAISNGKYDLVVYGHTHMPLMEKVGRTLVINPGDSSIVILELDDMNAAEISLV